MKCYLDQDFQMFMDGEMEPERLPEFNAHLESCGRCRNRLEVVRNRMDRCNEWLSRLETIDDPERVKRGAWRNWFFRPLTAPAGPVVCLFALLLILLLFSWSEKIGAGDGSNSDSEGNGRFFLIADSQARRIFHSIDLNGYVPMADPKIIIFKEVKCE